MVVVSYLLLFFTICESQGTAFAEDSVPAVQRIGIVDVGKLMQGYQRTKVSEAKLEGLSHAKQKERERLVSDIQGMREELILLNEASRRERQRTIEEKLKALASFDHQVRETLRSQREEVFQAIVEEVEAAVASYAKAKGIELVLSNRAVLYGVETIDVTEKVLGILNERYAKEKGNP